MFTAKDLDTLVRDTGEARERAAVCTDVSARIAYPARAAGYAKMIKALRP